ncbi:hypothetical protein LDHU3_35.1650:CDS1 [Leishmania donovani]|uniref:Hypothetical_protein n=2 Tax=Leishmania donovani species complex TaxID=38574 RepID=A0A6L0Y0L9_LEIIN|nr:hypothetical protein LdCL_350017300 [Leishmania donovani]CAC9543675.1 hypothetical_protein [Leishmania infantum]TPP44398.1 hypothetical protein CGC21_6155 [Leishmania donovani]TPP46421.1 hypothetical protein CGC20_0395 [Leishmania donovani]CAJ1992932.1 hypothetical protein LDHU3_35.1650:CDS1 [Leishmania donovani]
MSGSAYRDSAGDGLQEEEEEELGLPSSRTSAAEECSRSGSAVDGGKNVLSRTPDDSAMRSFRAADADDEFALDIPFVTSKGSASATGLGAFAHTSFTISSNVDIGRHQRRTAASTAAAQSSVSGKEQGERQLSIAGNWEKAENVSLNKYQGSDILDDSDSPQDEVEFQAWKARDAFRRQQLLL